MINLAHAFVLLVKEGAGQNKKVFAWFPAKKLRG